MKAIDILVEEHDNIMRLTCIIRKSCIRLLEGKDVPVEDFRSMISIIRNYADKHHHGKEEQLLFVKMVELLGAPAEKLVRNGMLVEHDMARLYVSEWENALNVYSETKDLESKLDLIAYATGYANLLKRHIDKENQVVYTFAERHLEKSVLEELGVKTEEFDKKAQEEKVQETNLHLLQELEAKYF